MANESHDFQKRLRIDFRLGVATDPATGDTKCVYFLDPSRYQVVAGPEEPLIFDRLGGFSIPRSEVQRMIEQAMTMPMTGQQQQLGDARQYIAARQAEIRRSLNNETGRQHQFVDRSEEFLSAIPDGVHGFAVLSIDLVGSTQLSNTVDAETFARVVRVILEELAAVVPYFHGYILKFTGDGVLAYFPATSFLTANDNSIDCALTMRGLIVDGINPVLDERKYPRLAIRVGIESGGAVAVTVGHESSKMQRDLIGQTLNIACKIQASGSPGEIRVGQVAYQNLHTMWKRGCSSATTPNGWPYKLASGAPYPIYMFTATGAIHE